MLDEDGQRSTEGELCVRGVQRFGGYLDPADNAGRFLALDSSAPVHVLDDSDELTDRHCYRTGDRVRLEGNRLTHLGRLDTQIKIRGYRVELGEIDTALRRNPGVHEAVVVALPQQHSVELVAFHTGESFTAAQLRAWLRDRVPRHMVPNRFIEVAELPLNPNGKTDRPALLRSLTAAQPVTV